MYRFHNYREIYQKIFWKKNNTKGMKQFFGVLLCVFFHKMSGGGFVLMRNIILLKNPGILISIYIRNWLILTNWHMQMGINWIHFSSQLNDCNLDLRSKSFIIFEDNYFVLLEIKYQSTMRIIVYLCRKLVN